MYYTIISRDEFIKLYRFGSIKINSNYLLNDDKNIETRLIKLFGILPLEYEESYIILKINDTICKDSSFETIQSIYTLNIEKIKSVYTLSSEAQHFYKTKVNQKVNFEITSFRTILKEVIEIKEKQDKEQGIDILSKQFDCISKEDVEAKLGNGFSDEFLKFEEYFSVPFKNFYLDLLSYKRENSFPKKDDIGFIYDLMIIATLKNRDSERISKFKQGLLKLDSSSAYKKLNNAKKETLFENIEFLINSNDEKIKKFIFAITDKHLVVGAIFLKIKYLLKEDNRDDNTQQEISQVVNSFSNKYKDELSIALYLIGLVYGYKNLYDDYYDFLDLDIFKEDHNTEAGQLCGEEMERQIKQLENDKKELEEELEVSIKKNKNDVQNINTLQELTMDELKGKIYELEKELKKYKKEKNQTTYNTSAESSSPEISASSSVNENHNTTIQKVESSEKDNNINIEGDSENSEDKLENRISNIETTVDNEKSEIRESPLETLPGDIIKNYLTYLPVDVLVKIAYKGPQNKKGKTGHIKTETKFKDYSSEELIQIILDGRIQYED